MCTRARLHHEMQNRSRTGRQTAVLLLLIALLFSCVSGVSIAGEPLCDSTSVFATATTLLEKKAYSESTSVLDRLRDCTTLTPLERFEWGWLYGRSRHFETALNIFKSVPANTPDLLTHAYAVALSDFELKRYQAAIEVLNAIKANKLFDEKSANLLGVAYSKAGRYDEAYAIFESLIKQHPDQLAGYLNLVTLCVDGGNLSKASDIAASAVQAFPQSQQAVMVLGAANTLLGRLDKAHDNFESAVRLAPANPDARFFLALTDYKQDKLNDAAGVLQSAVKAGIADSDLHYLMAECLSRLHPEDVRSVLTELDSAIKLNADSVSALVLRGKFLLKVGRLEQAVSDLEAAHHLDPKSRSAAYNLARAYRQSRDTAKAEPLFRQVAQQASDPLSELSDRRLNATLSEKESRE
jgi:tetratricopeptide (TPR) repeat protein